MTEMGSRSIFVADGTVRHWISPVGTALNEYSRAEQQERNVFNAWLRLTQASATGKVPWSAPALTVATEYLLDKTGLSNRQLASVLGTTHPTVASILRGHEPVRVGGLLDTIVQMQSVVQRIFRLTQSDESLLRLALHAQDSDGNTTMNHLKARAYSRAYLVAMDYVNQHKKIDRSGRRPQRRPSLETASLRDGDEG